MRSIYFRSFVTTVSIVLAAMIVLGFTFSVISYRYVVQEKQDMLTSTADEATRIVSAYNLEWQLSDFEVRMAVSTVSSVSGFHIIVCDTSGTVMSCSDREIHCKHIGESIPQISMHLIEQQGGFSGMTDFGGIYHEMNYVVCKPLISLSDGSLSGYVIVAASARNMIEMWRQTAQIFAAAALVVLTITFVVSFITAKKQMKPINEMAAAAHQFARGEFSVRVEETGRRDEIGELASSFNLMAESLERGETLRREFVANVSHELKTPMTTISGFADGILDGTIPPELQDRYLKTISSETKRLSRLVRNMLDMSRLQSMDPIAIRKGSFDVCEVARVALLSLEGRITASELDVDAEFPEEEMIVRGDKDSITQVVYNLLDNAIKFSAQGETIRISIWKQGGKVYVSVENRGETIPQEELPLIFDRFHKTDRSRSLDRDGVGLGLPIVKTILDNHQEDIYVSSADGMTRFTFTLTLRPQERREQDNRQE